MLRELSSTAVFTIRDAEPSDGCFIARNVLAAMGYDVFSDSGTVPGIELGSVTYSVPDTLARFGELCARPDTLYSYTRTRIACVDGISAGSLTAYPGDDYLRLRELTWGLLAPAVRHPEPECRPGEFYLDSMAILPEFRGRTFEYAGSTDRIGHLLMLDGIEEGRRKGFPLISLIVDKEKPRLYAYYSALGFRPDGEIFFFGHLYDRMVKEVGQQSTESISTCAGLPQSER